jgi:hypothetical protein
MWLSVLGDGDECTDGGGLGRLWKTAILDAKVRAEKGEISIECIEKILLYGADLVDWTKFYFLGRECLPKTRLFRKEPIFET